MRNVSNGPIWVCLIILFVLKIYLPNNAYIPPMHKDNLFDLPIYWINLDSAIDRNVAMQKVLRFYNHTRIRAITDIEAETSEFNTTQVRFYHNRQNDRLWKFHKENIYTFKELATSMSHLKAIRAAYESGHEFALILEDDAVIEDDFPDKLNKLITTAPKNWEILQLYVQHMKIIGHLNHVIDPWVLWQGKNWGATAYVINRKGMRKLLESMYEHEKLVFRNIIVADEMIYAHLNSYTSTYHLVKTTGTSSQIQTDTPRATRKRSQKINRLIYEKASNPITHMSKQDDSLSIVTQILSLENFLEDKEYVERWHNGAITWNIINGCPKIRWDNLKCITKVQEIVPADVVLLKSPHIRMPGFAWQTFWKKSKSATISSVLFSFPDKNLKYSISHLYDGSLYDSFFYYKLYTTGKYNDVYPQINRGAFFFAEPVKVDVVLQRFALLNGTFAKWLFKQPMKERLEFEWCGAASYWSNATACQFIPIGIYQNTRAPPPSMFQGNTHNAAFLKYSQSFREAVMKNNSRIFFSNKYYVWEGKKKLKNPLLVFNNDYSAIPEVRPFDHMVHLSTHDTYYGPILSQSSVLLSHRSFLSPIVIPEYKWILFSIQKIASSTMKKFIRKITDIGCSSEGDGRPQRENDGCFKFLRNYGRLEASKMLTDPTWTKSIFLRDPYARILSAFLFVKNNGYTQKYCNGLIPHNFSYFLTEIISTCKNGKYTDPHFALQSDRVPSKWWPYINFIGTLENFKHDFSKLIQKVGLWEKYNSFIFSPNFNTKKHTTHANDKIETYYNVETKNIVAQYYAKDFALYKYTIFKNKLPQVVIAGFQKCGTTSLRIALSKITKIQMYPKEMMYFLQGSQNPTLQDWHKHLTLEQPYTLNRNDGLVMAHMGSTFAGPIRILRHLQPETKIILLMRDPIERAFSAFLYFKQQENKNIWGDKWRNTKTFDDILKTTINNTIYGESRKNIHPALKGGLYFRQLGHIFGLGKKIKKRMISFDQVYIDFSERMWSNNFDSTRLQRFLGIDTPISIQDKYNERKNTQSKMSDLQRTKLQNFYKKHNVNLCRWLKEQNYKCILWLKPYDILK
tara:strand:- start:2821 stop:6057 length:3237 start_codon:yes stop_codon:yes gene_type:complete